MKYLTNAYLCLFFACSTDFLPPMFAIGQGDFSPHKACQVFRCTWPRERKKRIFFKLPSILFDLANCKRECISLGLAAYNQKNSR